MHVAVVALSVPHGAVLLGGALLGGYLVGVLPIAAIALGVHRRRSDVGTVALPPRAVAPRRNPTMDLLAEGGIRIAAVVVLIELLKGGVVGLGARLYDDSSWFAVSAIAGCVVGDAFPPRRPGRRGIVPLLSGVFAALPGTWAAGTFIAIPVLLIMLVGGIAYEGAVAVCVPLALVLGTHDLRSLLPAAIIVAALVLRSRQRRRAQRAAVTDWREGRERDVPLVVDAPPRH